MVGIGMTFAAEPRVDADIESTLLHASELGMVEGDLRVLSLLTTWMGVHHARLNADRLVRLVGENPAPRVRAYWSAVAVWFGKDRRLARLVKAYSEAPFDLLPTGNAFQLARRGADERFTGSKLRIPRGPLRDRPDDVLTPEALVRRHAGYRNRVLMGPTWRADVWTVLEREPELAVAEAARRASCSFAIAWQTAQDFACCGSEGRGLRGPCSASSSSRATAIKRARPRIRRRWTAWPTRDSAGDDRQRRLRRLRRGAAGGRHGRPARVPQE
jgi:hypothetical protein